MKVNFTNFSKPISKKKKVLNCFSGSISLAIFLSLFANNNAYARVAFSSNLL
jgi:hypothetical protein